MYALAEIGNYRIILTDAVRGLSVYDGVLYSYTYWNETIEISNSIHTIAPYAFWDNGLITLTIPASVQRIGKSAFNYSEKLESVTFNSGITEIGEYAFADNPDLQLIELHGQQVGEGAFSNCPNVVYCISVEEVGQYFSEGKKFLVKE